MGSKTKTRGHCCTLNLWLISSAGSRSTSVRVKSSLVSSANESAARRSPANTMAVETCFPTSNFPVPKSPFCWACAHKRAKSWQGTQPQKKNTATGRPRNSARLRPCPVVSGRVKAGTERPIATGLRAASVTGTLRKPRRRSSEKACFTVSLGALYKKQLAGGAQEQRPGKPVRAPAETDCLPREQPAARRR